MKEQLTVTALPGYEPEIGRWLWGLEDVRWVLKKRLEGITQQELDFQPRGANSVGSLLYHIAAIEADWFYVEVLQTEPPKEAADLFPYDVRGKDGRLVHVAGETLGQHLARLDAVRTTLLNHFTTVTMDDWRTPRQLPHYDVTPEWVIYHLIEHEAHHRGQIADQLRIMRTAT